jgi:hypothetical protein
MPKTKFSSAFLTSLIQNEQVAILSFRVLFLAHVDTLAHSGPAKEYRIAVWSIRKYQSPCYIAVVVPNSALPTTKTLETHNETYRHCRAVRRRLLLRSSAWAATDLVIATVNNGHMIEMQKLSKNFEQANPRHQAQVGDAGRGRLRQRVTTDIATKGGQFDVMTIGMYETPIWGKKGWLNPSSRTPVRCRRPAARHARRPVGRRQAVCAPFYGESSMLMYRRTWSKRPA